MCKGVLENYICRRGAEAPHGLLAENDANRHHRTTYDLGDATDDERCLVVGSGQVVCKEVIGQRPCPENCYPHVSQQKEHCPVQGHFFNHLVCSS